MSKVIGIDLGTTTARIAIMDSNYPVIIENSEGEGTTPSYVAITSEGTRLVGEAAQRYAQRDPKNVAFAVKRLIGRKYSDPVIQKIQRYMPYEIVEAKNGDAWIRLQGTVYAPDQIAAYILQKMKDTAEKYLEGKVRQAVISIPAYFNNSQIQSTRDAGNIAGLEVLRLVPEPVTAALAYGLDKKVHEKLAVFDLGGGTLDVSIMEIGDGVFEVKSTSGDMFLGGEDFDYKLADYIAEEFKQKYQINLMEDYLARQRLKLAAENAKIQLSSTETAEINLPFIHTADKSALHLETTITRQTFETLIEDFINRSIKVCEVALKEAAHNANEMDQIILVGGSTRIPAIQEALYKYFGKRPYGGLRREDSVALGAAVQGGVLQGDVKDVLLLDVIPLSFGIETKGGQFTRLIDRNTTFPTRHSQVFSTAEDNQDAVTIQVFQGDHEIASDNKLLGQFNLTDIPPAPSGVPQIEVTFDIDANGILNVTAKDQTTDQEQSMRVEPSGGLSHEEIQQMSYDAKEVGISSDFICMQVNSEKASFACERSEAIEPPKCTVSPTKKSISSQNGDKLKIFVSYAHEDRAWVESLEKAIKILTRKGQVSIWSDRFLKTGEMWEERIYEEIEQSNLVISLLSFDFFNSDFIYEKELPLIYSEYERRKLEFYPILVRPCPFELAEDLSKIQIFNAEKPFSSLEDWEIETEFSLLVNEFSKLIATK